MCRNLFPISRCGASRSETICKTYADNPSSTIFKGSTPTSTSSLLPLSHGKRLLIIERAISSLKCIKIGFINSKVKDIAGEVMNFPVSHL